MYTCATASRELSEPLSATAASARAWLLIEAPGPWGARALTDNRFDPGLGTELESAAAAHGIRTALIRRPGRHADGPRPVRRRVFLAHTAPGSSWIRTTVLNGRPGELLDLDFASLGGGDHGGLWDPYEGEPLALVCTNGKRDRCCALLGRPLATELAASGSGDVWEITHIGGHRFAPTLLVLPYGYAYGRASAPVVKDVLESVRNGHVPTGHCRGRSTWDRPGQAADLAVREHTGETRADALGVTRTEGTEPEWTVTVAHRDGRAWQVRVRATADGPATPASCGAAPLPVAHMRASEITPVDGVTASGHP